jgi:hypothetical protein
MTGVFARHLSVAPKMSSYLPSMSLSSHNTRQRLSRFMTLRLSPTVNAQKVFRPHWAAISSSTCRTFSSELAIRTFRELDLAENTRTRRAGVSSITSLPSISSHPRGSSCSMVICRSTPELRVSIELMARSLRQPQPGGYPLRWVYASRNRSREIWAPRYPLGGIFAERVPVYSPPRKLNESGVRIERAAVGPRSRSHAGKKQKWRNRKCASIGKQSEWL